MEKQELLQKAVDKVIDCCDSFAAHNDNIFCSSTEVICFKDGKIYVPLKAASLNGKRAILTLVPDIEFV